MSQTLKKKLKEKINELKEYELYKDVMESAVQKQSNEMRKLVADQERLEGRFKKERLNARQITQLKKKLRIPVQEIKQIKSKWKEQRIMA